MQQVHLGGPLKRERLEVFIQPSLAYEDRRNHLMLTSGTSASLPCNLSQLADLGSGPRPAWPH